MSEAAGNPARDRSCGNAEVGADRPVALVTAEEPIKNLLTFLAELGEAGAHGHRLIELRDHLVGGPLLGLLHEHDTARRSQKIETAVSSQLSDPGANCIVGAKRVKSLERLGKDILEDVLRVVVRQPERLGRNCEYVPGKSLDESVPGRGIALAAACYEFCVGRLNIQPTCQRALTRLCGAQHPDEDFEQLPRKLGALRDEWPKAPDREGVRDHGTYRRDGR